jgi:hypothetical protein
MDLTGQTCVSSTGIVTVPDLVEKNPFAPSNFYDFDKLIVLDNCLILQIMDVAFLITWEF